MAIELQVADGIQAKLGKLTVIGIFKLFVAAIDNQIEEQVAEEESCRQFMVKMMLLAMIREVETDQFMIDNRLAESFQPVTQQHLRDTAIFKDRIPHHRIAAFMIGTGRHELSQQRFHLICCQAAASR